jgi:SAM-dependent methyltransferase
MAHKLQQDFCFKVQRMFPDFFTRATVLDIGSGDVNGNNRIFFKESFIIGVDVAIGPNVDIVEEAQNLKFREGFFDTIISTECWEHNPQWAPSIKNAIRMLKPQGLFLFTCATTGRPEHGTSRSKAYQSFATRIGIDYYKNLTEEDIRKEIDIEANFENFEFSTKAQDLYFWGIKR